MHRLALIFATLVTLTVAATATPSYGQASQVICKSRVVPDGYVIVAETDVPSCWPSSRGPNAWVIVQAGPGEHEICRESPIPATHMIVSNAVILPGCPVRPGSQFNGYLIRIPWDQEVVCRGNTIDRNVFRILATVSTFECSDLGPRDNAYSIERRSHFRAVCAGRVNGAPAGLWRLVFDREGEDGSVCAQELAASFAAAGATSWEIVYGEYDFQSHVQLRIDCFPNRQTWVSAKGNAAFERADIYIASNALKGCLVTPTSFPVQRIRQ